MRFAVVANRPTRTNVALARDELGLRWDVLAPATALAELRTGDVALGRLDVLETLDGVDDGLWALNTLEARGVRVLNGPSALLAAHDKLLTARILTRSGLPHPQTRLLLAAGARPPRVGVPVVIKPRYGTSGRDVIRCETELELDACLTRIAAAPWFQRHGALVQQLVTPRGYDLRVIVAAGSVVGAVIRVARDGEWRTNVALGARRLPTKPPLEAKELALAAARAVGADLVGVDLLPTEHGSWTVLELNGAAEFTREYSIDRDVFSAARFELARVACSRRHEPTAPLTALR